MTVRTTSGIVRDGIYDERMTATTVTRSLKELLRHLVTRSGILVRFSILTRKVLGQNVDHLVLGTAAERFHAAYENRVWLNGRESGALSGLGSEIRSTAVVRDRLPDTLRSLDTHVLLDIGCGDLTWMKELELPCQYIGVDIVPGVIAVNAARCGSRSRCFARIDATRDSLPLSDTVLCREILFHLSFQDIWRLVENVHASGAKFMIATNDPGLRLNADIVSGDYRMLNLQKAPFRFPKPIFSLPDDSVSPDRVLSVWEVSALPRSPQMDGLLAHLRKR